MSAAIRKVIKEKVEECLKGNPRIQFFVDTIYKNVQGYDGVALVMWYAHQNGTDDERDPSQDAGPVRIQRLKVAEVNALANIAQQVANALPELEVILDDAHKGEFTYYFLSK
jgi:hypothetical protein